MEGCRKIAPKNVRLKIVKKIIFKKKHAVRMGTQAGED
jgi:hypothetical protein